MAGMTFGALTYNQYLDNREKLSEYIKAALPEYECSLEDLEQSVRAYQTAPCRHIRRRQYHRLHGTGTDAGRHTHHHAVW